MEYGGQGSQRRARGRGKPASGPPQPQLFDDTSTQPQGYGGGYPPPQQQFEYDPSGGYPNQQQPPAGAAFPGQQMLNDPMANMAVQYGQTLAGQGKDYIGKYMSTNKLKYYFAVDTAYVGKKLGLLLFPYAHKDWSIQYNQDEPVAPRYEINAPDLYIPVMAFVTYILLLGVALGTQNRFSPEHLGMTTSTAMVWLIIEIVVLLLSMYILRVSTDLKYYDLLAYCGYKYVGMILILLGDLLFESTGYYVALLWTSSSIAFFLVRTLKLAIIPHSDTADSYSQGNKRRLYMLLVIAMSQPIFMWFLTRSATS